MSFWTLAVVQIPAGVAAGITWMFLWIAILNSPLAGSFLLAALGGIFGISLFTILVFGAFYWFFPLARTGVISAFVVTILVLGFLALATGNSPRF